MRKKFIITGCQRSGTTVLKLLLDAHSEITVYDEDEVGFHGEKVNSFSEKASTAVCGFKLPMISNELNVINSLNPDLIVFLVRNPLDVIKSMKELPISYSYGHPSLSWPKIVRQTEKGFNLQFVKEVFQLNLLRDKSFSLPWYYHPECIDAELKNSLSTETLKAEAESFLQDHPLLRKRKEALKWCSYIWKCKNDVIEEYTELGVNFVVIKYEDLLSDPRESLQKICSGLNIPFETMMLEYHKKGKGVSIGNTRNDQPLMKNNNNKWLNAFEKKEIDFITEICRSTAERFGYNLNES